MADRLEGSSWESERSALTALAVVAGVLAFFVAVPYLQYVLLGVVLAYILAPAQRRLEAHVGSMVAALVLVIVAILAILLPLAYVLAIALREALEVANAVQEGNLGIEAIESWIAETGYAVDLVDLYGAYEEPIGTGIQGLATSAMEFVSGVPAILIGLTVTLFVLFALLRDGDRLIAWSYTVVPFEDRVQRELYENLDQLMWASVVGNVVVAGIQAVLLGAGLAVLGVPAVVFLTVATFVLALLPLVGAFGVWIPVALYLLVVGEPITAAILVAYGSLVSASDTYLRPALIGRTSAFNSAIVVVGIFGGLVVFGAVGLFIGPVVLGGAKLTLDVVARERNRSDPSAELERAADPAVDTDPDTGVREEGPVEALEAESEGDQSVDSETEADSGNETVTDHDDPESVPDDSTISNGSPEPESTRQDGAGVSDSDSPAGG